METGLYPPHDYTSLSPPTFPFGFEDNNPHGLPCDAAPPHYLHSPTPPIPAAAGADDALDDGFVETLLLLCEGRPKCNSPLAGCGHLLPVQDDAVCTDDHEMVMCEDVVPSQVMGAQEQPLDFLLSDEESGSSPFFHRLFNFFASATFGFDVPVPRPAMAVGGYMSAYQMLQELSPYVKFAHFSANQAILEATAQEQQVHVVDFDVMDGMQWPPLMADLLQRRHGASLRITAVVADADGGDADGAHRTGRRLREFADSIGLPLVFDVLQCRKEEDMAAIGVGSGALVANCMIHQLHAPSRGFSSVEAFLGGASRMRPKVVVLVEEELLRLSRSPPVSVAKFFGDSLSHLTALSESLAGGFRGGGCGAGLGLVEEELLGVRMMEMVGQFHCGGWRGGRRGACLEGLRAAPLSAWNLAQAKLLVGVFGPGYQVLHAVRRLSVCWKTSPLTTMSAWVPTYSSEADPMWTDVCRSPNSLSF